MGLWGGQGRGVDGYRYGIDDETKQLELIVRHRPECNRQRFHRDMYISSNSVLYSQTFLRICTVFPYN